jgi:FtsP/CotA-like multicopper oxidase with cupredoxin domain
MEGGLPDYFTINGRAYSATDVIHMKLGQSVKLRFIGTSNNFIRPMHVHGGPFTVIARDGVTLSPSGRYEADTINLVPGQCYDVIWPARRLGKWLIHCHIPHHTQKTTSNKMEEED